jgi:hypothetical protein
MKTKIILGLLVILLLSAWVFRWETIDIREDGTLTRYKIDRWTGQKWIEIFGGEFSATEDPQFDLNIQKNKLVQWEYEKKLGMLKLLKDRENLKIETQKTVTQSNVDSSPSVYDQWKTKQGNLRAELRKQGSFRAELQPYLSAEEWEKSPEGRLSAINENIVSTSKKAQEMAITHLSDEARRTRQLATYIWASLIGAFSVIFLIVTLNLKVKICKLTT